MLTTLAAAFAEVKPAATVTAWPLVEFHPERDVLDTEAASFAAWMAEEDADADMMADDEADAMAARWADDELTDRIAAGATPW